MSAHSTLLPDTPARFLWHYVGQRPWHFSGLLLLIVGAAGCAVSVQYGMKMLVDAMATDQRSQANVWLPLGLFISLIAVENLLWRLGGWLGCRTVVASVVDIRVDLFRHLTGHPMRYFTEHFAGALGNRITALGSAAGQIFGGLAWKIVPPIVDLVGAIVLMITVACRMAATCGRLQ
ncbi:ATP binding transporter 1 [Xanthomonas citri pv. aurantifolii str. ICPB 11122]|nr:ATP binding transporter 1 [Xanthomonas citri pv. aurantifolii str. ICPB 11122]